MRKLLNFNFLILFQTETFRRYHEMLKNKPVYYTVKYFPPSSYLQYIFDILTWVAKANNYTVPLSSTSNRRFSFFRKSTMFSYIM